VNIVVGSAWRNSSGHVGRYLAQIAELVKHVGPLHHVRVIAVEGDSTDMTHQSLAMNSSVQNIETEIVKCDHGGPRFGSTEEPARFVALSKVCNAILDAVRETDDVLVYVESDLLWDAHTVGSLIDMAVREDGGYHVFAPYIAAGQMFYDIWGFRKLNGERFSPFYKGGESLEEVSSVGSCLVMKTDVARLCRVRNDYCLVGWCEDVRSRGFRIAIHPAFKVRHP
jgi:hypothetical protein